MAIKRVKENIVLDVSQYHNQDTGELLSSELGKGKSITITQKTNGVMIDYDNYATISTEAMLQLAAILNNSDLANALKMSLCAQTPLSLLYNNNNQLHSNKTLQEYLEIKSEAKYFDLIRKLIKAGVLYQIKGLIHNEVRKIYMINPFLSKKRKVFDEQVIKVFKSFEK